MDDGQWWVLRDGITLGPYGLAELRQYTKRGKLHADDLVSAAGEADWSPAALAPALSDLFPKDGSEDATVALDPALRALAATTATPVPARRSHPADSPLRGSTLPPRLPTGDAPAAPAVAAPAVAKASPPVTAPPATVAPPPPRTNLASSLVIGLVAAGAALGIERAVDGPRTAPAPVAGVAPTPARADAAPAREPAIADAAVAVRVAPDAGARPAPARAQCVGAAALAGVGRTRELLRAFDELMRDVSPPADPFDYDALATACLTSVARSNDRSRASLDSARVAEALRVRRAAEARQERRAQQWRAMAFTWDAAWRTRVVNRSATYGCYDGAWSDDSLDVCPGEWRVRTPAVNGPVYALDGVLTEPELHRRVGGATGVHPEAEQFCEVLDAVLGAQRLTVTCAGDDGSAAYDLWLPRELAAPTAALAAVMVGDVLRVADHAVVRREPVAGAPRGAERWTFEEIPAAGVTIADRTRCCALTERTATPPR